METWRWEEKSVEGVRSCDDGWKERRGRALGQVETTRKMSNMYMPLAVGADRTGLGGWSDKTFT